MSPTPDLRESVARRLYAVAAYGHVMSDRILNRVWKALRDDSKLDWLRAADECLRIRDERAAAVGSATYHHANEDDHDRTLCWACAQEKALPDVKGVPLHEVPPGNRPFRGGPTP